LRIFAKKSHCNENLDFWKKAEELKDIKNSEDMRKEAKKIYKMFVAKGSPAELNISGQLKEQIELQMNGEFDASVFDNVQESVVDLMLYSGVFVRFQDSPEYKHHISNQE